MKIIAIILLCMAAIPAQASEATTRMLDTYRTEGAGEFSAERGKKMWTQTFKQQKSGKQVNCATCHADSLKRSGTHIRTGKIIEPMAISTNTERFNETKKIKKWFLRNCKWTVGRECTAQEKGDFLTYFLSE
jgi:cytochrome c